MTESEEIEYWVEQRDRYIRNHHRARNVGSYQSEKRNMTLAAECAAIVTSLRGDHMKGSSNDQ